MRETSLPAANTSRANSRIGRKQESDPRQKEDGSYAQAVKKGELVRQNEGQKRGVCQGYFGVKVTPLGSHLALLEDQEEGEVQALMEDAKEWLDQWFREIRPWSPKEIDLEPRLMIRTSCQLVVDEFIGVKINGEVFHLRVIEDSYGPMRIMTSQNQGQQG
ncbi:hypothetical protein A2U01_0012981, partial [Trifolium medium]|nr:hypothetical protein [Trifolium medium]